MENDFWKQLGQSFLVFSKFCDFDDWQNILKRLACEIVSVNQQHALSILDVGAGLGINTECIANIIFSQNKIRNIIDIIEPSKSARDISRGLLVTEDKGGSIRNIFPGLVNVKNQIYDVIMFIHSSYYINNFYLTLNSLLKYNLREGGKILILALPSESPFFLDPKLELPFTSSQIQYYLSQNDINFNAYTLTSKFFINTNFIFSQNEINQLYHFMTSSKKGILTKGKFCEILKSKAHNGIIDFQDELIVIEKDE